MLPCINHIIKDILNIYSVTMFHKAVRLSYQASEFTKILKHNLSNGHKGRDYVAQVRQLAIVDVVGAVASNVGKAVSGAAARR